MAEQSVKHQDQSNARGMPRSSVLLAAVSALSLGAAGYIAVGTGLVPGQRAGETRATQQKAPARTVFLALEPFMTTLPRTEPARQLRLEVQLEVEEAAVAAVRAATPRLQDTMNRYLRSIELAGIEDPDMVLRMRLQLLRRLQVAAGEGRIRDLLITQLLIS